jgi:hypothetical protein
MIVSSLSGSKQGSAVCMCASCMERWVCVVVVCAVGGVGRANTNRPHHPRSIQRAIVMDMAIAINMNLHLGTSLVKDRFVCNCGYSWTGVIQKQTRLREPFNLESPAYLPNCAVVSWLVKRVGSGLVE